MEFRCILSLPPIATHTRPAAVPRRCGHGIQGFVRSIIWGCGAACTMVNAGPIILQARANGISTLVLWHHHFGSIPDVNLWLFWGRFLYIELLAILTYI